MSRIKRRQFLQFAGSALATIGLSQLDIMQQCDRYAKVLAQSTPRKIALLVGLNDYPNTSNFPALQGCVTAVELQRELLIYRFGFNPKDMVTKADGKGWQSFDPPQPPFLRGEEEGQQEVSVSSVSHPKGWQAFDPPQPPLKRGEKEKQGQQEFAVSPQHSKRAEKLGQQNILVPPLFKGGLGGIFRQLTVSDYLPLKKQKPKHSLFPPKSVSPLKKSLKNLQSLAEELEFFQLHKVSPLRNIEE